MCGFAGYFHSNTGATLEPARMKRMIAQLAARGPDDSGIWQDPSAGIALGHRRLAILDLSPAGHQPMLSVSGRYVIVFNGEIYNYRDLRHRLDIAHSGANNWRGSTDTEVLLTAIETWGIKSALQRSIGMFALALWDREQRSLILARDRVGEKPLYYGWSGGDFLLGSELKALRAHPAFCAPIDRNALTLLLRHNYIPAPWSIYQGIYKLPPASIATLTWSALNHRAAPHIESYWSLRAVAAYGSAHPLRLDDATAIHALDGLLHDAVAKQCVADVPLGAFLSGGVDSSTIVACMQAQAAHPIKTFTIGFDAAGYNEAQQAQAIAKHLGTEHTELYVTAQTAQAVIPRLPQLYDEPFADASQIPTFLVAQLARSQVTVSLSGDAGDELFGGYHRYFLATRLWKLLKYIPLPLRSAISRGILYLPASGLDRMAQVIQPLLPRQLRYSQVGDKAHKLARLLGLTTSEQLYQQLVSHWDLPEQVVINGYEPLTALTDPNQQLVFPDMAQRMMYLDALTYLPDDILVKVDRAAMGVSLESRVPFLDHRLIEFAWRLPLAMKIRHGQGKWLLRQVLYQYVPPALVERPKMGFGVPIDQWLRGPLRDWAETLLNETGLGQDGYFNPQPIRTKWAQHLAGTHNWQYHLWSILMFQAWRDAELAE